MGKKKIVVLTGAGVSAESGISTFRDNGGLWDRYDVNDVASIDGWFRNRKLVLDFYNLRRAELEKARPNAAHLAIAALENRYEVTVVTQNVDNLHERAGSTKIIHLHGELTKVRPETGVYDSSFSEAEIIDVGYSAVHLGDTAPNGSQLRPQLQVYPAAGLYRYAPSGCPIYIIDPKEVPVADPRITQIREVASRGMEIFQEYLEGK